MNTKNQFVASPWNDTSRSIMLEIMNSYIRYLNPDNHIEHKRDVLDKMLGQHTNFSRDVLRFENEHGQIVGFAGLTNESRDGKTWKVIKYILPEYLNTPLPQFVMEKSISLAKKSDLSEILLETKGEENPFDRALNDLGYFPIHFAWGMWMIEIDSKEIPAKKSLYDITIQYVEELDDYTRFAFIYNEDFRSTFGFNETSAKYWKDYMKFQNDYFDIGQFFGFNKQTLVGFGYVCTHKQTKITYGRTLAVLPEYQNKGIGSELIKNVLEFLQNKEIKEYRFHVDGMNDKAMDLYKRFGFQELKKTTIKYYRLT